MRRSRIAVFGSLVLIYAMLLSSLAFAKPDEGMFMPDQISKLPIKPKGARINALDLYNPNGGGLSEAIVRVNIGTGGHGTGEFVSPDGLILTNHHVGFDALVAKSTKENNLGENGFTARSVSEEMEAAGYSVMITQRSENVTDKVLLGVADIPGKAREDAIKKNIDALIAKEKEIAPAASEVTIQSLNSGYFYYLFQTLTLKDVRVVYAPPKSIGAFGGDDDNFEWTRHCADFAFLRAYVGPDGKPAPYAKRNVPFKPRKSLAISLNGIRDGEFNMVLGYPGTTTRYRESQNIEFAENYNFPFVVDWLGAWNSELLRIGQGDPEKKIKLQSEVANLMNTIKSYSGGIIAMRRAGIVTKRKEDEAKFATWVNAKADRKAKYGSVLEDMRKLYIDIDKTAKHDRIVRAFPGASTPIFNAVFQAVRSVQSGTPLTDAQKARTKEGLDEVFKSREPSVEKEVLKFLFRRASQLPAGQRIESIDKVIGNRGVAAEEAFAKSIAENDRFDSSDEIMNLYSMKFEDIREINPQFIDFVSGFGKAKTTVQQRAQKNTADLDPVRLLYMKGMSEMKNKKPYPDANGTLRFGFGNVKGYKPREAITYTPFTTLKGVVEKDTGKEPFNAPPKLLQLQKSKDFGRYGQGDSVPVNFLSTVDIIGGNSGSPVLNGAGDQVGLVFDGNFEGLGNDIFVSDDFGRTIAVDIRYVLFITEKYGNASWIFQEMNIKGGRAATVAAGR